MGLAEALSDDGAVTGRGSPVERGHITALATLLGAMLHILPFLIRDIGWAMHLAYAIVVVELLAIAYIRWHYMRSSLPAAIAQVIVGGASPSRSASGSESLVGRRELPGTNFSAGARAARPADRARVARCSKRERQRRAGLKPTMKRTAIAWLITASPPRHLTPESLYEEARVSVSMSSIYNIVRQFAEKGLLRERVLMGGFAVFDTGVSDHHHFVVETESEDWGYAIRFASSFSQMVTGFRATPV